jgi:hypothetical protein
MATMRRRMNRARPLLDLHLPYLQRLDTMQPHTPPTPPGPPDTSKPPVSEPPRESPPVPDREPDKLPGEDERRL